MSRDSVVIWGTGVWYDRYISLIKKYDKEQFTVVGVTSDDTYYSELDGYPLIKKEDVAAQCSWIIVCVEKNIFSSVKEEIISMGIDEDKIIYIKALEYYNFNFEKYTRLVDSHITIFSNNCWGGIAYNKLALKVRSPFHNMWESANEYIDFLNNAEEIFSNEKLIFRYMEKGGELDCPLYPIFSLGGLYLHMCHFDDRNYAEKKWHERSERINWNNIFAMIYTDDISCMEKFSKLPYDKKICFTTIDTDIPSTYKLYANKNVPLWELCCGSARGRWKLYDLVDLLLTGKSEGKRIDLQNVDI